MAGGVAAVAGAGDGLAFRVGLAMTLLQLGIGAVNDVVDASRDAGHKPGKPIPAGLVTPAAATRLAIVCFAGGLGLAWSVSLGLGGLAVLAAVIGLGYDLRLKGTAWSWLPFAVGIPLLPVFGWLAATGGLPPSSAILVPVAAAAGAALAIGNALVDVERDRAAGSSSIALALGPDRAGRAGAGLLGLVWVATVGSAGIARAASGQVAILAAAGAVPLAAALLAARRGASSGQRERAWQAEAVGLAITAALWLAWVAGPSDSPR